MNILASKKELTAQQKYFMVKSPAIRKMSDIAGQTIEVENYLLYETANNDGEVKTLLSILTPDNECFTSASPTFISDFQDVVECFGNDGFEAVKVVSGRSRAGRTFIQCEYVR